MISFPSDNNVLRASRREDIYNSFFRSELDLSRAEQRRCPADQLLARDEESADGM